MIPRDHPLTSVADEQFIPNYFVCQSLLIHVTQVVRGTLDNVVRRFKPDVVVCQCGADGITGDPHKVSSLSPPLESLDNSPPLYFCFLTTDGKSFKVNARTCIVSLPGVLLHPLGSLLGGTEGRWVRATHTAAWRRWLQSPQHCSNMDTNNW